MPAAIRYGRRLRQALQSLQPTIVHAHGLKMQLLATWSRPSAIPLVLHLHDYVGARRFASQLLRVRVPRRAVAVAISRSVAADADTVFRGRLPIRVVHNGVDLDYWSGRGAATDLDAACGLPPAPSGTVRVGLVATMARWKGHGVFLEAIAKLANELPVRGYVIGGSIYQTQGGQTSEPELRRVAASLGIGDRVGFTGFLGDPAAAMRALDVVVHASTRPEPFGRVVVEGMALGRAVVTSGTGGSAELIIPGLTALTFRAGDALDLADRLATLIRDPQLRAALGREGVLHASRHFGCSAMIAGLLAAYRYAMASTGGREGGEERDGGVMVDAG